MYTFDKDKLEFNGVAKATEEALEYAGLRKPAYKTLEEMRKCAEEIKKEKDRINEAEVERYIRDVEREIVEAMAKGALYVRFTVSPPNYSEPVCAHFIEIGCEVAVEGYTRNSNNREIILKLPEAPAGN